MKRKAIWIMAATAVAALAFVFVDQAVSQDSQPAREGRGNRGGRGNFDPAEFRAQMEKRMQEALNVNDEEFKALQPKIEKVMTLQRDARGGMMMGMMGRGPGGRGPGGQAPDPEKMSDVQKKAAALRKVLDDKDSKADDVKTALKEYRDARDKAKTDLVKAQEDLKKVVSARQEAVLVTMNVLD